MIRHDQRRCGQTRQDGGIGAEAMESIARLVDLRQLHRRSYDVSMEQPLPPNASGIKAAVYSVKLEALRGLAALMVVGHYVFPPEPYYGIHVIFNGRAAVSLFFVLSGYVLGLSLRRGGDFASIPFLHVSPGLPHVSGLFRHHPCFFGLLDVVSIQWRDGITDAVCRLADELDHPAQEFSLP